MIESAYHSAQRAKRAALLDKAHYWHSEADKYFAMKFPLHFISCLLFSASTRELMGWPQLQAVEFVGYYVLCFAVLGVLQRQIARRWERRAARIDAETSARNRRTYWAPIN